MLVVLGTETLIFENVSALTTQKEVYLNSCQLCAFSSLMNTGDTLTPGNFVSGKPSHLISELDLCNITDNRLNNFPHLQKMVNFGIDVRLITFQY